MTTVFFTLLALATLGVVVAVAAGRITGGLDDPVSSLPARGLPDGPLRATDIAAVRFSAGLRGYRMDEVDRVVDTLARELRRRDAELASLREKLGSTGLFPLDAPPPEPAGWFGTGPIPLLPETAPAPGHPFEEPQFEEPQFEEPQFEEPQFEEPQFEQPRYDEPYQPRHTPQWSDPAGGRPGSRAD